MERPEFLNTVTVGDARRKYRENQKSLDNMMLLVSSGTIQEVFNGDNEWVFNQVMTETIIQQEYIREREKLTGDGTEGLLISASREAAFYREDEKIALQRKYYRDRWNENKVWEVVKLVGGYYLRQYISGHQVGRGVRTTKGFIKSIGVFEFEEVGGIAG